MKPKIFKSKFSDLEIDVSEFGWILLKQNGTSISLGKPPNARFELLMKAIKYVEKNEQNKYKKGK